QGAVSRKGRINAMNTGPVSEFDLQPSHGETFLERLAEKIGVHARASTVFGDPVERDGVTVIPVARARWGFGGGGGGGRGGGAESGSGGGGGGGMVITPVGYIEMRAGKSRFRPIRGSSALLPLLLAGGSVLLGIIRTRAERRRERE